MIRYTLYGYDPRYADTNSSAVTEEQDETGDWVKWEDVEDIKDIEDRLKEYIELLNQNISNVDQYKRIFLLQYPDPSFGDNPDGWTEYLNRSECTKELLVGIVSDLQKVCEGE